MLEPNGFEPATGSDPAYVTEEAESTTVHNGAQEVIAYSSVTYFFTAEFSKELIQLRREI